MGVGSGGCKGSGDSVCKFYISIGLNGLSTISGLNVLATIKDLLRMVGRSGGVGVVGGCKSYISIGLNGLSAIRYDGYEVNPTNINTP